MLGKARLPTLYSQLLMQNGSPDAWNVTKSWMLGEVRVRRRAHSESDMIWCSLIRRQWHTKMIIYEDDQGGILQTAEL